MACVPSVLTLELSNLLSIHVRTLPVSIVSVQKCLLDMHDVDGPCLLLFAVMAVGWEWEEEEESGIWHALSMEKF